MTADRGDGTTAAVAAVGLSKVFGAVCANDGISLAVEPGTIHGIVGENGAGKSTLLKMLFGFYRPDGGHVEVAGVPCTLTSPADAMTRGIGMVHQHFMLVDPFTVLENIILGAESSKSLDLAMEEARPPLLALEEKFGFNVPLDATVETLPVGTKQRVEILKAIYRGADILILDEPTAVLTPQECEQLFDLMRLLRDEGKTIVFVTHKLDEIKALTDRVTVIRGGKVVCTHTTTDVEAGDLAEMMVGKKIRRAITRADNKADRHAIKLALEGVNAHSDDHRVGLRDISLRLLEGEILGIAGVAGNGQSELLEVITGLRPVRSGKIWFNGQVVADPDTQTDPRTLRDQGMGMVAEDRLQAGIVENMTAAENAILGYQHSPDFVTARGVQRRGVIADSVIGYFDRQDVRPSDPMLTIGKFSGGNQQKLVMAREFARNPDALIIGQPTRGVDIGAVTRIHDQLTALRNEGKAILVVSADLEELFAICDRIAVMCGGRVVGTLPVEEATDQLIGLMMAGQDPRPYGVQNSVQGGAHG